MLKNQYSNYFKTTDGQQIYYATNFKLSHPSKLKNVLVFNYGLVCSHQHWEYQLRYFDQLGYQILIHHYRGHFQSAAGTDLATITISQIAHDINELLNFIGIEEAIFIGHSMGVNTTLELAKKYPEKFQGLILVSGTVLPVTEIMLGSNFTDMIKSAIRAMVIEYPELTRFIWNSAGYNPVVKKLVHILGFNHKNVPMEFVDVYLNKTAYLGPEIFVQLFEQMSEHDILAWLERLKTPVLIIGGERDVLIPNYLQMLLHQKISSSELYIMHDASHVPQVDFPELFNQRVQLFLDKIISQTLSQLEV